MKRERREAASSPELAELAEALNALQIAGTVLLTPEVIAELHKHHGFPLRDLQDAARLGMRWNPERGSFVSLWE